MVPLRFVVENLGCDLQWDSSLQKITISTSGTTQNEDKIDSISNSETEKIDDNKPEASNKKNQDADISPEEKGQIEGGKYIYDGKTIFEIQGTLDWAAMSPNEQYIVYRDGQEINYYDISNRKHIDLYRLTTDEYMGKYVYNYGFTSPTNYDFVKWADDSSYIVVNQWTNEVFKGGSGYYKIDITTKEMTKIEE